jgi:poly-gamma-glutamate synthesis protein (capsule biosynthesis protein)
MFGFTPDPDYSLAPFHPQAINAMLGRVRLSADGSLATGFTPLHVDPPGRPRPADAAEARRIIDYIEEITVAAGLAPLSFEYRDGAAWLR